MASCCCDIYIYIDRIHMIVLYIYNYVYVYTYSNMYNILYISKHTKYYHMYVYIYIEVHHLICVYIYIHSIYIYVYIIYMYILYIYVYIVKPAHFHLCITACTFPVGSTTNQFSKTYVFLKARGSGKPFGSVEGGRLDRHRWWLHRLCSALGGISGCGQPFVVT